MDEIAIRSKVRFKKEESLKPSGDINYKAFLIGPEIIGEVVEIYWQSDKISVEWHIVPGFKMLSIVDKELLELFPRQILDGIETYHTLTK